MVMENTATFESIELNSKITIKPAHSELRVLALHPIYASDRGKIRLSVQNCPVSKPHRSPSIQGSWLPSPGEIPMGPASPMELFALWPLDGSVNTQTTSSGRGSVQKHCWTCKLNCRSGGCDHFLRTASWDRPFLFVFFVCSGQKYIKNSRRFSVLVEGHFLCWWDDIM